MKAEYEKFAILQCRHKHITIIIHAQAQFGRYCRGFIKHHFYRAAWNAVAV